MVFTLTGTDNLGKSNGNTMATVRMILVGAGLMACGLAFAEGGASVGADSQAAAAPAKAKPSIAAKKSAKTNVAAKGASESKTASSRSGSAASRAGSGRMQVEEPKAAAPMGTAKESRNWQKNHARGLTEAQKQAFRERKEKMEGMIAVIKEKRKALRDAKPEERAILARELHSLILEKDPDAANSGASATSATARVGTDKLNDGQAADHSARPTVQPDAAKKSDAAEQRRQRIESYQSQQKKEELRKLQIEKQRSGLDNGGNTGNSLNAQAGEDD
jgi:hypothetical protein